jgi:DNA-binding response OmpR family regulator
MPDDTFGATILVVDDEESVAGAYALQLGSKYGDVHEAHGGEEALERTEELDVDVVLLDRRMPDMSGDEVLDALRERGHDCRVIMTTAVEPDFDIVEMPFDDYLCKPIEREDLYAAVDQQARAENYEEKLSEYYSINSKIALLETEKTPAELEDNDEYEQLSERAHELDAKLEEEMEEFDDVASAFTSINRT